MHLTSPAFAPDQPIPRRYSSQGEDLSPPLMWDDPPPQTRSFALVVEDPDAPAGTFRHWAAYDIGLQVRELPEGFSQGAGTRTIKEALNDFGNKGYGGPKPPPGHGTHHYHFRLMALAVPKLDVAAGAKIIDVVKAAQPHTLAQAELIGTYEIEA